ncbi:MAG: F0F1 ATP synthase subunit gamma [Acidobacteriota bacterium]|nr:F0F1 ATP synthase subunit gamma [Acidobacteriota bacterium]
MSENIQSLRHRIDSAGDLEGVVRAMKALAASSIGQYQKAVEALDDYYRTVELGLSVCLRQADTATPVPDRKPKDGQAIGVVVFGSDQGLVGRFNEVVADLAVETVKALPGKVQKIWAIGERVRSLLSDAGIAPVDLLAVPVSIHAITPLVGHILIELQAAREKREVVDVYVFHNRPKSAAVYEPVCRRLLPLDDSWQSKLTSTPWPSQRPNQKAIPEIIGDASLTLKSLVSGYLFVSLYQSCAESLNSENASRLAAMQRAEKNIKNIVEDLNQKFHRVRQASIDEELFDVVSGFEALSAKGK